MAFDEKFYKYKYMRLREVFDSLIESVLGQEYYNIGIDTYSCDEYSGEDITIKCGKKYKEAYNTILNAKANANEMRLKIEKLEKENEILKQIK